MDIPGYTKLKRCPKTPECTRRALWRRDDTGELFQLGKKGTDFVEHACTVKGSELPKHVYIGEWHNKRTGRTRWIGPTRLRRSAEIVPNDYTSAPEDWELKGTLIGSINWDSVKED